MEFRQAMYKKGLKPGKLASSGHKMVGKSGSLHRHGNDIGRAHGNLQRMSATERKSHGI